MDHLTIACAFQVLNQITRNESEEDAHIRFLLKNLGKLKYGELRQHWPSFCVSWMVRIFVSVWRQNDYWRVRFFQNINYHWSLIDIAIMLIIQSNEAPRLDDVTLLSDLTLAIWDMQGDQVSIWTRCILTLKVLEKKRQRNCLFTIQFLPDWSIGSVEIQYPTSNSIIEPTLNRFNDI